MNSDKGDNWLTKRKLKSKRRKLEKKAVAQELMTNLNAGFTPLSATKLEKRPRRDRKMKRTVAWLVLLAIIGALLFPAIGAGFWMFMATLSFYVYLGFVGLAVTLVAAVAIWAIWTLVKG